MATTTARTRKGVPATVLDVDQDENGNGAVAPEQGVISLTRLTTASISIRIEGTSPYIPHSFGAKAREGLPGHPNYAKIAAKKPPHDPEREALDCLHLFPAAEGTPLEERLGAPAPAFKAAMISAVGMFSKLKKVNTKLFLHVVGEGTSQLVRVHGDLELKEDWARNSDGSVDLRYRYYVHNWWAVVPVEYTPSCITRDSVYTLLNAAGKAGIGDWRPSAPKSSTGTYGMWRAVTVEAEGMVDE